MCLHSFKVSHPCGPDMVNHVAQEQGKIKLTWLEIRSFLRFHLSTTKHELADQKLLLIDRHLPSIQLNWTDTRSFLSPKKVQHVQVLIKKEAGSGNTYVRMKTWVTPICFSSPLPPPLLPWRPVWNGSKPYAPEKTILCLNGVSWPLSQALQPIPHSPGFLQKTAFC